MVISTAVQRSDFVSLSPANSCAGAVTHPYGDAKGQASSGLELDSWSTILIAQASWALLRTPYLPTE